MCGRFTLTIPTPEILAASLGVPLAPAWAEAYRPRFNVAPGDATWVVRAERGVRELSGASWGLVPRWSKSLTHAGRPINARAETLDDKPAFRDAWARRRAIVVSDGFFEWKKTETGKQPLWFHPRDGGLLLLGGLWDEWTDPGTGEVRRTFAIVTTPPNGVVSPIHDRMPLVIAANDVDTWLTAGPRGEVTSEVRALLRAAPDEALTSEEVSRRVNDVRNDDPGCLTPDPPGTVYAVAAKKRAAPAEPAPLVAAEPRIGETLSLFGDAPPPARKRRGS